MWVTKNGQTQEIDDGTLPYWRSQGWVEWRPDVASEAIVAAAWAANTAYFGGQLVWRAGQLYRAKADFTSGGSFNATNWDAVGSGAYAPLLDSRLPLNTLSRARGVDLPGPRQLCTGTTVVTIGKNSFFGQFYEPAEDVVVTQIAMASTATVSAGLTVGRLGIYHVGRWTGATDYTEMRLTPIARTASDTTIFNVANTLYQKNLDGTGGWPTSVRLVKGQRYYVGWYVEGTTAPTIVSGGALMRAQSNGLTVSPLVGVTFVGLADTWHDLPDGVTGTNCGFDGGGAIAWINLSCDPLATLARPYRTALIGDSYVASYPGWFGLANAQAASRLLPNVNAGKGGDTTSQVIARLSEVTGLSPAPEVVVVDCGKNDIVSSIAATAIEANLTTIINAMLALGAKVIVNTQPPTSSMTGPQLTQLAALNTWIKALSTPGVYVADVGTTLSTGDGVTLDASKVYGDGTHPNVSGRAAMATPLTTTIAAVVTALGG